MLYLVYFDFIKRTDFGYSLIDTIYRGIPDAFTLDPRYF